MSSLNELNELYFSSEEGDKIAVQELLPVVVRYNLAPEPKILEIGTGMGRNLLALSKVSGAEVIGSDVDQVELAKAQTKITKYNLTNVKLVVQPDERRLPFGDSSFDAVVLWQVLEHVLSDEKKQALLSEVSRVTKHGGVVMAETPNAWFPIDHHDTNLPLVHWLLPNSWRQKLIVKIRKNDRYPPSQYINYFELKKWLANCKDVAMVKPLTRVYFQEKYLDIFKHWGGTRLGAKKIFFTLYFPFYLLLRLFGLSGDLFCPSLRVVFRVFKRR